MELEDWQVARYYGGTGDHFWCENSFRQIKAVFRRRHIFDNTTIFIRHYGMWFECSINIFMFLCRYSEHADFYIDNKKFTIIVDSKFFGLNCFHGNHFISVYLESRCSRYRSRDGITKLYMKHSEIGTDTVYTYWSMENYNFSYSDAGKVQINNLYKYPTLGAFIEILTNPEILEDYPDKIGCEIIYSDNSNCNKEAELVWSTNKSNIYFLQCDKFDIDEIFGTHKYKTYDFCDKRISTIIFDRSHAFSVYTIQVKKDDFST